MNEQNIQQVLHAMLAIDDSKTYAYSTRDFEDENSRFGWIDRDDGTEINVGEKSSFELMDEPSEGLLCEITLVNRTSLEPYGALQIIKNKLRSNVVSFALEEGGITFDGQNIACVLYAPLESRQKVQQILQDLGVTFEQAKTLNPKNMDQNQIINHIDDLLAEGKQTTKIFFDPLVLVVGSEATKTLPQNWAGRILPGQTIEEGIAAELKDVYNYTGRFAHENIYFQEYAKDRKGNTIERYAVTITLFPSPEEAVRF